MTKRDYYEVLGIGRDTGTDDIKKAYRKLAMKFHPDRNPGSTEAEDKFKEAAEAYDVLSDSEKRQRYDQFGHEGVRSTGYRGYSNVEDIFRNFGDFFNDFGDIFDGFGGGRKSGGRRSHTYQGQDLQVKLGLTLEEIQTGITKKVKIKKLVSCETCGGTGAKDGNSKTSCQTCGGNGEIRQVQRTAFGQFVNITACGACNGEGTIIKDRCPTCNGQGVVRKEKTIQVTIPVGVSSGNYITLRGQGDAGKYNGVAGDLIVVIEEKEHDYFERHGDDILLKLRVSFTQAVMGDKIDVPTLNGRAKLTIPPGIQSGKILRMRSKGLPHLNSRSVGDQLVLVLVYTPITLSKREKELFAELAQSENSLPRDKNGIFRKIRDYIN